MAVAARRLGAQVEFYSKVGDDVVGHAILAYLKEEGMHSEGIVEEKGLDSNLSLLLVSDDGNYMVSRYGTGYKRITANEVGDIEMKKGDIVISALSSFPQELIHLFFSKARRLGCTVILNCGPMISVDRRLLDLSDYIVMNDAEFAFHSRADGVKHGDAKRIVEESGRLRKKGQVLVVTLGDKGFVAIGDDAVIKEDGYRINAVNTSGAGDCFTGAMATCLADGKDLDYALRFANAAAALSVQELGAASSMPHKEKVIKILSSRK
jgi:ribokinase